MGKYVFAYSGGGMPETEEEGAKVMAAWEAWYGALGEAVVDGGNPFGQTKSIAANGAVSASDAPLTGYTIVNASDIDAAVTLAKGCPILESGGSIEVAETIDM